MKINYILYSAVLLLMQLKVVANPLAEPGKQIFVSRCAACHNVNKDMTGPALAGVDLRHTMDWIINFVHSPQKIIKSGDAYATGLFSRFNNITMPDHPDLKASDIKSVVEYIKLESKLSSSEKPPFSKPGKLRPAYSPLTISGDYGFFICFLAFICVLIGVMLSAVDVKAVQRKRFNEIKKIML